MTNLKILGFLVILVFVLSLVLTSKSYARPPSATGDVMILICDEDGDLIIGPTDLMSTANPDTISSPSGACDSTGDDCGVCMAALIASTSHSCKFQEATYGWSNNGNTRASSDDPVLALTIICNLEE